MVMDEVGFRIPGTGFRIPKPRIPDSKGEKLLDSEFRIPLHGATQESRNAKSALAVRCS